MLSDYPELVEVESPEKVTPIATAGVRNVRLFVVEPMPAELLETFGGASSLTPYLRRYAAQSTQLTRLYAHVSSTNKPLFSLLASSYPWLSYKNLTAEFTEIDLPTVSSVRKRHGYRTAFIASDDTRYQRRDEFLARRGFDELLDARSLGCEDDVYRAREEDWNRDAYDDACLVDSFTDWLDRDAKSPFFTMFWSGATHYR
jgi:hypothetical protein